MLIELRIENLLLIERAELSLDAGFNAITGETGAGKTMLAHAIDLLLGGKSRKGIVRPGAEEAYVEGLFALPDGLLDRAEFADIRDRMPDPNAVEIALARRVTPEGRTRAYIEGRSATAAELRALGGALVSFFGQHEHRKLTLAGTQLATLDGFCDEVHRGRVAEVAKLHEEARVLERRLTELEIVDGRRERELGLVLFELAEIDELQPDVAEHASLSAERERLRSVDTLRAAGEGGLAALSDDDSGGATALVAGAVSQLTAAVEDPALAALAGRVETLAIELQDVSAELRAYCETLSDDPERLAYADERLDAYERLTRKHGGSVASVIQHGERCREDRDRLGGCQEQIAAVRDSLILVRERQRSLAGEISTTRRKAGPRLAASVRDRLAELALADAAFEIEITTDLDDLRSTGGDAVEFLIAPNPGIAAAPLRESASGGELSRVMLALLTASRAKHEKGTKHENGTKRETSSKRDSIAKREAGTRDDQTFVFDEIDAGIGGHTARSVGEHLRALGVDRQVICITHLPQVAAVAQRHFQIEKIVVDNESRTEVRRLNSGAVVDELCRMLGAGGDDAGARRHVKELMAVA